MTEPKKAKMLKRDWIGRRVRSTEVISNSFAKLPVGTEGEILSTYRGDFEVMFDVCNHCKIQILARRVWESKLELIPEQEVKK